MLLLLKVTYKFIDIRYLLRFSYRLKTSPHFGNLVTGYFCEVDGDDTPNIDIDELATANWHHKDAIPEGAKDDGISLTREMIRVFSEGL